MNHIVAGSCKLAYIFWIVSYLSVAESDVFHSGDMVVGALIGRLDAGNRVWRDRKKGRCCLGCVWSSVHMVVEHCN